MYIQMLRLHIPEDMLDGFEAVLHRHYISLVQEKDGFLYADILVDPASLGNACLMVCWRDVSACRAARCDCQVIAAFLRIAAELPGVEIRQTLHSDPEGTRRPLI